MRDKPAYHQIQNKSFSSFDELRQATLAFDVDFRPLTVSSAASTLFQFIEGPRMLSHTTLHSQVEQRGSLPPGTRTLALPVGPNPRLEKWYGQDVTENSLLLFPDHGEIDCVSQPGFEVFILTLPESELLACAEDLGISEPDPWIDGAGSIFSCAPKERDKLLSTLKNFQRACVDQQAAHNNTPQQQFIKDTILNKIVNLVDAAPSTSMKIPFRSMQRCIDRTREFVDANQREPLKVRDLCKAASVSERTLERVFKRYYGVGPKQFLKSQKLFGFHRSLLAADPVVSSVSMLANHWGYWHMGQLARDYQYLFGELPSETLNRS